MPIANLETIQHIAIDSARLCAWLMLACAIFIPLERLCGDAVQARQPRRWLNSLAYYFMNGLAVSAVLSLPFALCVALAQHTIGNNFQDLTATLPFAARCFLIFILGELGFYWGHRLSHRLPWLWRFHAIHHETPHLNFLANTRAHPVDLIFTRLCGFAPLYLLGLAGPSAAGSVTPAALIVLSTVWSFFLHANVRWRLGPLEALLATPAFHHWHHSRNGPYDKNFSSMLPLLDRLFGSHYLPKHWPEAYGIQETLPSSLWGQLMSPFRTASTIDAVQHGDHGQRSTPPETLPS